MHLSSRILSAALAAVLKVDLGYAEARGFTACKRCH